MKKEINLIDRVISYSIEILKLKVIKLHLQRSRFLLNRLELKEAQNRLSGLSFTIRDKVETIELLIQEWENQITKLISPIAREKGYTINTFHVSGKEISEGYIQFIDVSEQYKLEESKLLIMLLQDCNTKKHSYKKGEIYEKNKVLDILPRIKVHNQEIIDLRTQMLSLFVTKIKT